MNLTNIRHYVWLSVQDSVKNSAGKFLTAVHRSAWASVWTSVRDIVQVSVSVMESVRSKYEPN
jgi:hypothetical protein